MTAEGGTNALLVFLALFVTAGSHAIFNPVNVKHGAEPIEGDQAKAEPGRGRRRQQRERDRERNARHEEKADDAVPLVNVTKAGHNTEHDCDRIARLTFRGLEPPFAHPAATLAARRIQGNTMTAARARSRADSSGFSRGVCVFQCDLSGLRPAAKIPTRVVCVKDS